MEINEQEETFYKRCLCIDCNYTFNFQAPNSDYDGETPCPKCYKDTKVSMAIAIALTKKE